MNKIFYYLINMFYRYYVLPRYYNKYSRPIQCEYCNDADGFREKTVDSIDFLPCESEIICDNCREMVSYRAYGYFEPVWNFKYVEENK